MREILITAAIFALLMTAAWAYGRTDGYPPVCAGVPGQMRCVG